MSFLIENAVTISEVAAHLQKPEADIEAEATALFGPLGGVDWRGSPAISVADAAALATGVARRDLGNSQANLDYTHASEAWTAERERVRLVAFTTAHDAMTRRGIGASQAAAEAHEPAREAVAAFERSTPKPVFGSGAAKPRRITKTAKRVKEMVAK